MKKTLLMGAAFCAVLAMVSCGKSKESAYKKAYEKAKAQQTATQVTTPTQQQTTAPVTVVQQTPATTTPDYSNVSVRTENVQLVSGNPLKAYSVVVGSFGVKSNATGLASTLANKGYASSVVQAATSNGTMYRVIATSYNTKAEAAQSRAALEGQYPGAWLLYQK